ncbi:esterase [Enterobacteriaceae bacterium YMB-R22]|uniref:esterase n=1 Tax=Tenebrionicola larvae TaxID=2815733 RepID=UPI002012504B|nr:esterase [Tenebrionicola larvae]MBV4412366.1 esterase [Tenebrionicola larvae]
MILNARLQTAQNAASSSPVVLIHGLFGSLDNLGVLARDLAYSHDVLQLDLRNHGLSPRSDEITYAAMARDVLETLDEYGIKQVTPIGHSMGGKVAMALSALAPERLDKLVVIDIAPVAYPVRRHDKIFAAIRAVSNAGVTTRQDAAEIMRKHLAEEGVIQFLLKSFSQGGWRFNVPALWNNYDDILGWQPVPAWDRPALFIRGGESPYIQDACRDTLLKQFPRSRAYVIAGAGHWAHAEKPQAVLRAIHRFLNDVAPV